MLPSISTMTRLFRIFPAVLALALGSTPAVADPVRTPHADAELVVDAGAIEAGKPFLVALRLQHESGWHTYWKNPGDSGMPTRIRWTLPPGFSAGPILWPVPQRIPVGPLTNYGYGGDLLLLSEITPPPGYSAGEALHIEARADWLVCKDICLPAGATLALDVPAADSAGASPWGPKLRQARSAIPAPLAGWVASAAAGGTGIEVTLAPRNPSGPLPDTLAFFPDQPDVIDNSAVPVIARTADGALRLGLRASPQFKGNLETLSGIITASPAFGGGVTIATVSMPYAGGVPAAGAPAAPAGTLTAAEIAATASAADSAGVGLALALALAFAGGIVLNLMPCVFPLVSIKVLCFAQEAGCLTRIRTHALAFAAGVVVCFWVIAGALLALRASGSMLGWGFQLQSPPIVAGLAVLFFVLGMNLSGVFDMGLRLQTKAGDIQHGGGLTGAFLSGLLATVVATPCTAPFMGAALGYAVTQPAGTAMLVFTALALGMAAPYLLLGFAPGLLRWLPRPGRWMETLRQLLAFPLYLTVVWLLWVLSVQAGTDSAIHLLAGLVLVAAALWAWSRFHRSHQRYAAVAAAALVGAGLAFGWPGTDQTGGSRTLAASGPWQAYSDEALGVERGRGVPVFVDFTAAWCVTCQVNKRLVLESTPVRQAFADGKVVRLRADWTNQDARITRALARLGRSGVPVYALYPADGGEPRLLPELLTSDLVLKAIADAGGGRS